MNDVINEEKNDYETIAKWICEYNYSNSKSVIEITTTNSYSPNDNDEEYYDIDNLLNYLLEYHGYDGEKIHRNEEDEECIYKYKNYLFRIQLLSKPIDLYNNILYKWCVMIKKIYLEIN